MEENELLDELSNLSCEIYGLKESIKLLSDAINNAVKVMQKQQPERQSSQNRNLG